VPGAPGLSRTRHPVTRSLCVSLCYAAVRDEKRTAYATAEVPAYLIVAPYQGRCHLYTQPEDGGYLRLRRRRRPDGHPLGLTIKTDKFPQDQPDRTTDSSQGPLKIGNRSCTPIDSRGRGARTRP
jgi:hypothetical protein